MRCHTKKFCIPLRPSCIPSEMGNSNAPRLELKVHAPHIMILIQFPWLERLEAACFYSGRNIKTEALGRSAGPVQNVIMDLPDAHSWKAIREELKRCFSDQTSLGHGGCSVGKYVTKT